jgi:pSer/pThr/pTyr-binding forkhead associated (FHA) protein
VTDPTREPLDPARLPTLLLRARDPAVEGETLRLTLGQSVTAGRSRRCGWSLKRTLPYLEDTDGARATIRASLAYTSVSRHHCRITFLAPDRVEVANLATNGTLVDGRHIDRLLLEDVRFKTHTIQLGPEGVVLELSPGSLPI